MLPPFYKGGIYILEINENNFPDELFREYISNTFDQEKKGYLTNQEVENVQEININKIDYSCVGDLTGIEYFYNLEVLDCSERWITSLDVSKNLNLIYLDCYRTQITSLDVSNNPKLDWLDCSDTGIKTLDVSKNLKLTFVYCHNTPITSLDVSNNSELYELWCYNTGITSLDVRKNPKLERLSCFGTGITSLDVSNNPALVSLNCQNTEITSLDLSNNAKLYELWCDNTGITSLNIRNNPSLQVIAKPNLNIIKNNFDKDNNCKIPSIEKAIKKYSYKNRYNRELKEFDNKVAMYKEMSDNELLLTYCKVSVHYKNKQMLLWILSISFIIFMVTNSLKYSYILIEKAASFSISIHDERVINIAILISAIFIFLPIVIITISILSLKRERDRLYKEKMILENVKERKNI